MTEVIGDVLQPSELVLPLNVTPKPLSGQMFLSGTAVCYYNGSTHKLLADA